MTIRPHEPSVPRGFTLIEVVLAIVIAVGLLTGVLMFYRQASVVREEVLRKADALSAVRLVMDRISTELRTTPPDGGGTPVVSGDSRSLRMLHTAVPSRTPWRGGNLGRVTSAEADWVEVSYRCSSDTNRPGLFRQERTHTAAAAVSTNLPTEIEQQARAGTNTLGAPVGIPISEAIGHLRFRYWDGSRWSDAWERPQPPVAVEVSLGIEPDEEDGFVPEASDSTDPSPYPFEVFRRVIALPAGAAASATPPSAVDTPEGDSTTP